MESLLAPAVPLTCIPIQHHVYFTQTFASAAPSSMHSAFFTFQLFSSAALHALGRIWASQGSRCTAWRWPI
jgi:hypothetical protein